MKSSINFLLEEMLVIKKKKVTQLKEENKENLRTRRGNKETKKRRK